MLHRSPSSLVQQLDRAYQNHNFKCRNNVCRSYRNKIQAVIISCCSCSTKNRARHNAHGKNWILILRRQLNDSRYALPDSTYHFSCRPSAPSRNKKKTHSRLRNRKMYSNRPQLWWAEMCGNKVMRKWRWSFTRACNAFRWRGLWNHFLSLTMD